MANVKISGLPEATSVAETDELEVNQAGTSRRADKSLIYKAPTRTKTTISAAASTSVSIPAGCARVVITSEAITMSTSAANFNLQIYNTGDTVQTTVGFSQWQLAGVTSLAVSNTASGGTAFAAMGALSNTDRLVRAEVLQPRNSGVETTFNSQVLGESAGTDQVTCRFGVADSATDDDTIRVLVSTGTLSGTVYFDWFY